MDNVRRAFWNSDVGRNVMIEQERRRQRLHDGTFIRPSVTDELARRRSPFSNNNDSSSNNRPGPSE